MALYFAVMLILLGLPAVYVASERRPAGLD
jgi:hypothetical protein